MKEYVEREALINLIEENSETKFDWSESVDIDILRPAIKDIPAADVAPVKHGEWVLLDECSNEGVYCSICHKKVYKTEYANQKLKSKYCPNCGAKMDGGKNIDD